MKKGAPPPEKGSPPKGPPRGWPLPWVEKGSRRVGGRSLPGGSSSSKSGSPVPSGSRGEMGSNLASRGLEPGGNRGVLAEGPSPSSLSLLGEGLWWKTGWPGPISMPVSSAFSCPGDNGPASPAPWCTCCSSLSCPAFCDAPVSRSRDESVVLIGLSRNNRFWNQNIN